MITDYSWLLSNLYSITADYEYPITDLNWYWWMLHTVISFVSKFICPLKLVKHVLALHKEDIRIEDFRIYLLDWLCQFTRKREWYLIFSFSCCYECIVFLRKMTTNNANQASESMKVFILLQLPACVVHPETHITKRTTGRKFTSWAFASTRWPKRPRRLHVLSTSWYQMKGETIKRKCPIQSKLTSRSI